MKNIEYLELLIGLFKYKIVFDELGNEFVLFLRSKCNSVENIKDKTEFEALENHVHLLDSVNKYEFERLTFIAEELGQMLLNSLKYQYPNKGFIVFVSLSLNDSMIIRFHQKWKNEEPYYSPSGFKSEKEKVFAFEA